MTNEVWILACGVHSLGFAIFHILFPTIFRWREDLKSLKFFNRAILHIANIQLIFLFLFVSYLCFFFCDELLNSKIGNLILFMMSLFWLLRLITQIIFLKHNRVMIFILSFLFALGFTIFLIPAISY
jgi:hypothetical protein